MKIKESTWNEHTCYAIAFCMETTEIIAISNIWAFGKNNQNSNGGKFNIHSACVPCCVYVLVVVVVVVVKQKFIISFIYENWVISVLFFTSAQFANNSNAYAFYTPCLLDIYIYIYNQSVVVNMCFFFTFVCEWNGLVFNFNFNLGLSSHWI